VTDENFSNAGNTQWSYSDLADDGQAQNVSLNGDLFLIKGANGTYPTMAYMNPATLTGRRADACGSWSCSTVAPTLTQLSKPQFSPAQENLLYGICNTGIALCSMSFSNCQSSTCSWGSVSTIFDLDAATGKWMSQSKKWTLAPPVLTVGAQNCTPTAGVVCPQTSGGSLADGTYEIVFDWRDATDQPTTEQDSNDENGSFASKAAEVTISGGGGNGSITGLPPAACTTCGLTPDSYSVYALLEKTSTNWPGSCTSPSKGTAVACPWSAQLQTTVGSTTAGFTITSLNTTSRINESCGTSSGGGNGGCIVLAFETDKSGTYFFVSTGGLFQQDMPLDMVCSTAQNGCRWFDHAQGVIANQSGAWTAYPTGPPSYGGVGGGDDNCQALLATTSPCAGWRPYGTHEINGTLGSRPYFVDTIASYDQPVQPYGLLIWDANTLNVSTLYANHTASSAIFPYNGGHIAMGWDGYAALGQGLDQSDVRSKQMTTFWSTTSPQLVLLPVPNSSHYSGTIDQHMNWADANASDTMPWFNFEYPLISYAMCGVTLGTSGTTVSISTAYSGSSCNVGTSSQFLAGLNNPGSLADPTPQSIVVENASDPSCDGTFFAATTTWQSVALNWTVPSGQCISGATGATIWPANFQLTGGGPLGAIYNGRAHMDELWAGFNSPGFPTYRLAELHNDLTTDTGSYKLGSYSVPNEFYLNPRGHCDVNGKVCMFTSNMLSGLGTINLSPTSPRSDVFIVYIR